MFTPGVILVCDLVQSKSTLAGIAQCIMRSVIGSWAITRAEVIMLLRLLLCGLLSLSSGLVVHCSGRAISHAAPPRSAVIQMAGFGGASSKGKGKKAKPAAKEAPLSPKRQWDKFKELVSGGAPRVKVFAQLDDKFIEVGDVAVDASGTSAQAAQFNKRLILEHAVRVNPSLQLRARELKLGVAGADGSAEALPKQDVPSGLSCGFEGLPDSTGKYAQVRGTTQKTDPTAIIGSAARN